MSKTSKKTPLPSGCRIEDGVVVVPHVACPECGHVTARKLTARDEAAILRRLDEERLEALERFLAQLPKGRGVAVAKVKEDVAALRSLGMRARRAVCRKRSPEPAFDDAEEIAAAYGAEIVRHADPLGMMLGIKRASFPDRGGPKGKDSSFMRNFVFVA